MGLFGLTEFELLWERAMDTKCLMASNPKSGVAVLAFRGTASLANVLADVQVGLTITLNLTPVLIRTRIRTSNPDPTLSRASKDTSCVGASCHHQAGV